MTNDSIVPTESQDTPYYDDYDETKGFHRILFRPGRAVQARELTQLQTILQKQIQRFGKGIYENGSMVTGGLITFQGMKEEITSLNLSPTFANASINLAAFNYATINSTNSLGIVLSTATLTTSDPNTLIIKNLNGNPFKANDTISIVRDPSNPTAASANVTSVSGASIVSISEGVYFYNGYFIGVYPQTLILEKYSDQPTYRIGLEFSEEIVDENSDTSLFDPAQEASNYQGPGATRYKVDLTLAKRSLTSTDDTHFIELLRVENGIVRSQVSYPVYSDLAATMARRTFDESGNYTVRPFLAQLSDHIPDLISGSATVAPGSTTVTGSNTKFQTTDVSVNSTLYLNNQSALVSSIGSNTAITLASALTYGANGSKVVVKNPDKFSVQLSAGKAYISGYEFETIAPTAISVRRGREIANVVGYNLDSTLGNYVYVSSAHGIPDIGSMEVFDIHITTGSNVNLTSTTPYNSTLIGNTKIRAFEYSSASNTSNSLTHIYKAYLFDTNIANATYTLNAAQALVSHLSSVANGFNKVLTIDTSSKSNNNINGNTFVTDTGFTALIFPYPQSTIKAGSITNVDYQYRKLQSAVSFISGVGSITLSSPDSFVGSGVLSETQALTNFVITVKDKGNMPAGFANGDIIPMTTLAGRSITVSPITVASINTNISATFTADVLHSINLTGTAPGPRSKTQVYANTANVMSGGTGTTISTTNTTIFVTNAFAQIQVTDANSVVKTVGTPQKLYVADVINLKSVLDFGGRNITAANLSLASNVTSSYVLDNGQRDSYYDHASISLKSGATIPTGPLLIYADFYTHSGTSGYLTVDSYPNATTNDGYSAIPSYTSPTTGRVFSLRDCVDWRPIRQNATEAFTLLNGKILEPGNSFTSDFAYYLARIDKIILSGNKNFKVLEGVSSLYPEPPVEGANDMLLYTLKIPPFTFNPVDVDVRYNENKCYTMRDIGRIEKRVENLEYYTSLNLLEKSADALTVTDSTGLNRFKNGIVVDGFTGHKIGDVSSYDYVCSMDFEKGELRPPFNANNSQFVVNALTNAVNKGNQITLDYTLTDYIVQNVATNYDNINPFNYSTWIGTLRLIPDQDTWYDITNKPQVLVNLEGENDAWEQIGSALSQIDTRPNGFGTRYSDWKSTWSGITAQDVQTSSAQVAQDGSLYLTSITRTTTSTTDQQTRQITTKSLVPETITKSVGDNIVDVSVIPYIREKDIVVFSNTLKPLTTYFPFFDGVNLLPYWINPTLLVVNLPVSGALFPNTFSEIITGNTGGSGLLMVEPQMASMYGNTAWNYVTVVNDNGLFTANNTITGSIGGATAVVTAVIKLSDNVSATTSNTKEIKLATTAPSANVFNISLLNSVISIAKGNGAGQIRTITAYNAASRIVSLDTDLTTSLDTSSVYSLGAPLSDPLGVLVGTLHIPNSTAQRFLTGEKKLRMTSSPSNSTDEVSSYADGSYFAQGILETKQETVVSARVPTVVVNTIGEERSIVTDTTTTDTATQLISRAPVPTDTTPQALIGSGAGIWRSPFGPQAVPVTNINNTSPTGNYKKFGSRWYMQTASGYVPWNYTPGTQIVYNPSTQTWNLV